MNGKNIMKMCKMFGNRALFRAKKYSPEMCLIGAAIAGIGCVIEACKATKKSIPIVEEYKDALEDAEKFLERNPDNFDEAGKRRYKRHIHVYYGGKLAKTYGKAAVLGLTSGSLTFAGYRIIKGRNISLAAALAAEKAKNLELEQGKNSENDPETSTELQKTDENKTYFANPDTCRWKFLWAEGMHGANSGTSWLDPKMFGRRANPMQLEQYEDLLNVLLPVRQVITMHDICTDFGVDRRKMPKGLHTAGWVFDPKKGDHQISLGIHDPHNKEMAAFMAGDEVEGVWIIPNCDDYIEDKKLPTLSEMAAYFQRGGRE